MTVKTPIHHPNQALQLRELASHARLVAPEIGPLTFHDLLEASVREPLLAVEDDICG